MGGGHLGCAGAERPAAKWRTRGQPGNFWFRPACGPARLANPRSRAERPMGLGLQPNDELA